MPEPPVPRRLGGTSNVDKVLPSSIITNNNAHEPYEFVNYSGKLNSPAGDNSRKKRKVAHEHDASGNHESAEREEDEDRNQVGDVPMSADNGNGGNDMGREMEKEKKKDTVNEHESKKQQGGHMTGNVNKKERLVMKRRNAVAIQVNDTDKDRLDRPMSVSVRGKEQEQERAEGDGGDRWQRKSKRDDGRRRGFAIHELLVDPDTDYTHSAPPLPGPLPPPPPISSSTHIPIPIPIPSNRPSSRDLGPAEEPDDTYDYYYYNCYPAIAPAIAIASDPPGEGPLDISVFSPPPGPCPFDNEDVQDDNHHPYADIILPRTPSGRYGR